MARPQPLGLASQPQAVDDAAALRQQLECRDAELAAARRENTDLRLSHNVLEAVLEQSLRQAEQATVRQGAALAQAQQSLSASIATTGTVQRELHVEEQTRAALIDQHIAEQAMAQREAAATHAAVTAELDLSEQTSAMQASRSREEAVMQAMVLAELGATERSLARAATRAQGAERHARSLAEAGPAQLAARGLAIASASTPRADGVTLAESDTGPSGAPPAGQPDAT